MDDTADRSAEPPAPPALRLLTPVTVLVDADETVADALDDWSRGLEWVCWLFSSVRQRMEHLHFAPPGPLPPAWAAFAQGHVRSHLGPHLIAAAQAVLSGDLERLKALDHQLSGRLDPAQAARSREAGGILLRNTRGARYQGILGRYRSAQEAGQTPGHFLTVWAGVGNFFQLSLANVIAEYLRLEWDMAARHLPEKDAALSHDSIASLTRQILHGQKLALRVVA